MLNMNCLRAIDCLFLSVPINVVKYFTMIMVMFMRMFRALMNGIWMLLLTRVFFYECCNR